MIDAIFVNFLRREFLRMDPQAHGRMTTVMFKRNILKQICESNMYQITKQQMKEIIDMISVRFTEFYCFSKAKTGSSTLASGFLASSSWPYRRVYALITKRRSMHRMEPLKMVRAVFITTY